MHIQDAIHGYIVFNDLEERLVDTAEMQRLRRIKQLGFSQLVYPSATHSRFEHSLGAFHLAGKFAESLDLSNTEAQELRLAALFHDLGHGPFSHATDYIYHAHDLSHEEFSKRKIVDSAIGDTIRDAGYSPDNIVDLVSGNGKLGSLVAGHIDVDRMDYLMRDAYYTGVAYGTIDADTIIRSAQLVDDTLLFDGKYVNALESLLTARYLMIPTVYTHRVSRIAARMFRKAVKLLYDAGAVDIEELTEMDEPATLCKMRAHTESAWLTERIENRDLYKIAARFDDANGLSEAEIEQRLLDATGMDEGEILVDYIELDDTRTYDVPIIADGTVHSLEEFSPLPAALKDSLAKHRELRVYAAQEDLNTVGTAAEDLLG